VEDLGPPQSDSRPSVPWAGVAARLRAALPTRQTGTSQTYQVRALSGAASQWIRRFGVDFLVFPAPSPIGSSRRAVRDGRSSTSSTVSIHIFPDSVRKWGMGSPASTCSGTGSKCLTVLVDPKSGVKESSTSTAT